MLRTRNYIMVLLTVMLSLQGYAKGQPSDSTTNKGSLSVEIDPLVPIVLKGIGAHVMWEPKGSKHFLYGIGFIFKATMPDIMINMNPNNKNKGWRHGINRGLAIEGEYYYSQVNQKWFSGLQVFAQQIILDNVDAFQASERKITTGMVVITTGYKWFPLQRVGLYVKPWLGLSYTNVMDSTFPAQVSHVKVGAHSYHIQALMPFGTIHVGYKF